MDYLEELKDNLKQLNEIDFAGLEHCDQTYNKLSEIALKCFNFTERTEPEMVLGVSEIFDGTLDVMELKAKCNRYIGRLLMMESFVSQAPAVRIEGEGENAVEIPSDAAQRAEAQIKAASTVLLTTYHMRHYVCKLRTGTNSKENAIVALSLEQVEKPSDKITSKRYEMLQYFLNMLFMYGAKRKVTRISKTSHKCTVWFPKRVDGTFVYHYYEKCDIRSFMYSELTPINTPEKARLYNEMTNPKDLWAALEKDLTYMFDSRFEDLEVNPNLWSFKNCCYNADDLCWYPYDYNARTHHACKGHWAGELDFSQSSYKYIDVEVDYEKLADDARALNDWGEEIIDEHTRYPILDGKGIHIPELEKIFDHQKFDEEVKNWKYVFLGKLLYPLKMYESWEAIMLNFGQGGTGKSAEFQMFQSCMANDIGLMNNKGRQQFAFQNLLKCRAYLCMDMDNNFDKDETTFKSMVTGEGVQVDVMYDGEGQKVIWLLPGAFAGNQYPPFINSGNSMARRIVIFYYATPVVNADATLLQTFVEHRRPAFLYKTSLMYRHYAQLYNKNVIYDKDPDDPSKLYVLPQYFMQTSRDFTVHTNQLYAFLSDPEFVEHTPDKDSAAAYSVSAKDLRRKFASFCSDEHGVKMPKMTNDYIQDSMNHFENGEYDHKRKKFKGLKLVGDDDDDGLPEL